MQLLITASLENILAQLNESAATPSPGCSACKQGQTIYSIDIDVIAREFVAKSENRLATFGHI